MTKKRLYVHVVLDRSGSMTACLDSTISAFNEYVNSLRQGDASVRLSLTFFDSQSIDLIHDNLKAKDVPLLTKAVYIPRSMTPLNDAIGVTVARIDAQQRREGENVALVILTDGLENASREYTKEAIKATLAARQADKKWLVIYLGANQDAWAEGAARGTMSANTMSFDTANVGAAVEAVARSSMAYAATGNAEMSGFTAGERAKATAKKPKGPGPTP